MSSLLLAIRVELLCHMVVVAVQSLSHARLFVTPQTAARQASLPFTITQSLFKVMSIELVMLWNNFRLCHSLLLCYMVNSPMS